MNIDSNCARTISALHAVIERKAELPPEVGAHINRCPQCRQVAERLGRVVEALAGAAGDGVTDPIAERPIVDNVREAVLSRWHRTKVWRSLAIGGVMVLLGAAIAIWHMNPDGGDTATVLFLLAGFAGVPAIVAMAILRLPASRRLYKRVHRKYRLSGVCEGLAERTGLPVGLWRLGFVLLTFWHGAGLYLYLLLDIAMPIHPEDRPALLRFRLARGVRSLWARLRSAPA